MTFPNTVDGCGIASLKKNYGKEFTTNKYLRANNSFSMKGVQEMQNQNNNTYSQDHLYISFFAVKMGILQKPTVESCPIGGTSSENNFKFFVWCGQ